MHRVLQSWGTTPVLLYNYPRRYKAFFYCNSVSFMLSIALIILLVNRNLYIPAIRSNALSVCTAVGMFSIVGAYAAGSTQHLKTSIYIFVLAAVVLFLVVLLVVVFSVLHVRRKRGKIVDSKKPALSAKEPKDTDIELYAKQKYVMTLGILVASVTYQAGLKPPGGMWQGNGIGHTAGNPIMHDNMGLRYQVFFYVNTTSFVASIIVTILMLLESLEKRVWWQLNVLNTTIALDLFGLLVAYAVGSTRSWKTTGKVLALVVPVLTYITAHVTLSWFIHSGKKADKKDDNGQSENAALSSNLVNQ